MTTHTRLDQGQSTQQMSMHGTTPVEGYDSPWGQHQKVTRAAQPQSDLLTFKGSKHPTPVAPVTYMFHSHAFCSRCLSSPNCPKLPPPSAPTSRSAPCSSLPPGLPSPCSIYLSIHRHPITRRLFPLTLPWCCPTSILPPPPPPPVSGGSLTHAGTRRLCRNALPISHTLSTNHPMAVRLQKSAPIAATYSSLRSTPADSM